MTGIDMLVGASSAVSGVLLDPSSLKFLSKSLLEGNNDQQPRSILFLSK